MTHYLLKYDLYFQCNHSKKRSYFTGKIIPKPVITTKGLCFAINSRSMKDVFNKNNYIDKFESVFGENAQQPILTGEQHLVQLEVDIQSKYLTHQTEVSGNFWYENLW